MGKYWLKIGLGASLIFLVGFGILSAGRHIRGTVESNRDVVIPLGAFGVYLPFKLEGSKVGDLRSLAILRSEPKVITGFAIRVRVADSPAFERLRECKVSISDATHFDERTTFVCLDSDSGYQAFGELRAEQRNGDDRRTIIQPLLLTEAAIREFRKENAAGPEATTLTDSLASVVQSRVKSQAKVISDSVKAAVLESRAKDMQRRADSIRAGPPAPPVPPAGKP